MGRVEIVFVFGTKYYQDLPEYPVGAGDPFVFKIATDNTPSSRTSAMALLGYYEEQFIQATAGAGLTTVLFSLIAGDGYIPTCYLDCPTIEVDGIEMLIDGEPPNPWLSLKKG